jgi:ClpP class serine protease
MAIDFRNFCRFVIDGSASFVDGNSNRTINVYSCVENIRKQILRKRVKGIIIHLKKIEGGFSELHALHEGILKLRKYNKQIIAFSVNYNSPTYLVASACTEIWCTDAGHVIFDKFYKASFIFSDLASYINVSESVVATKGKYSNLINESDYARKFNKDIVESYLRFFSEIVCKARNLDQKFLNSVIENGIISCENSLKDGLIDKIEREFRIITDTRLCSNNKWNFSFINVRRKIFKIGLITVNGEFTNRKFHNEMIWPLNYFARRLFGAITPKDLYNQIEKKSRKNNCVILIIESGGGDLAHFQVVRDLIFSIKDKIPIYAYCSNMCLSSAYYIASACTLIGRHPMAPIGQAGSVVSKLNFATALSRVGVHVEEYLGFRNSNLDKNWTPWTGEQISNIEISNNSIAEVFFSDVEFSRKSISSEHLRAGWISMPNDDSNGFYDFSGTLFNYIEFIFKIYFSDRKNLSSEQASYNIKVDGLEWRHFRDSVIRE